MRQIPEEAVGEGERRYAHRKELEGARSGSAPMVIPGHSRETRRGHETDDKTDAPRRMSKHGACPAGPVGPFISVMQG